MMRTTTTRPPLHHVADHTKRNPYIDMFQGLTNTTFTKTMACTVEMTSPKDTMVQDITIE